MVSPLISNVCSSSLTFCSSSVLDCWLGYLLLIQVLQVLLPVQLMLLLQWLTSFFSGLIVTLLCWLLFSSKIDMFLTSFACLKSMDFISTSTVSTFYYLESNSLIGLHSLQWGRWLCYMVYHPLLFSYLLYRINW